MQAPITVNYTPDGQDWTVTVTGRDTTRKAKAAGLIAARDRADQLVEQIAPNDDRKTVVHLLDGDAYAFTTNYLHARLGLVDNRNHQSAPAAPATPTPTPTPVPVPAEQPVAETDSAEDGAPRPADVTQPGQRAAEAAESAPEQAAADTA